MRLWGLPIAILAFLPFGSTTTQVSWGLQPTVTSVTLVDALSADPDYTLLIGLLQRAKLIPTLNRLNATTLFAPTNDAIERHKSTNSLWRSVLEDEHVALTDNVQDQLRQELFYHLLNYTISEIPEKPQVLKTLHYPRAPPKSPTRKPPPSPPWMPVPGGSLGGEPQRLRAVTRDETSWVGVDAFGKGGSKIVKPRVEDPKGHYVLLGIADVLQVPLDLAHVVAQHSSVSYFHNVLTLESEKLLNTTSELTLFLPVNSAWDELDPLERKYLESEYATDDLNTIIKMHAVAEKSVAWSESFKPAINLTTIDGTNLEIVASPEKTMISTASLVEPDIYASNGVLHLISSLLIPPGALQLTPEKYLLTLNCSYFVSLLHSVNLTSFINDTEAKYTILAPRDDVFSVFGDDDLPERGSEELKRLLQYHFLPGRWMPKKLKNGMLLETALEEPGLGGGQQVLSIEVSNEDDGGKTKKPAPQSIRFGGAGIIGEYIEVNNTIIYFVSRPLIPPSDALQTALPILDLSSFLAAVFSTSLADVLKTTPRTSLLIPHNSAFKRLGLLVSGHLLAASSKQDLEKVLLHHTLSSVQYSESIVNGSQHTFATLESSDLQIERTTNGSVFVSASGGWSGMKAELYPRDILTKTGVVHELSDVLIPRTVELTVGKLVKAAKGSTMATMVMKAGFDWVLNGTAPPEGTPWADTGLTGAGWTLLCPTDDAFKQYNLTKLYDDIDGLREIVSQHIIPTSSASSKSFHVLDVFNNNRPLLLDDSATYSTLRSSASAYGDIVFREEDDKKSEYVVGIKGARGTDGTADWARVLSWGRSTTGGGTGGVIQIDRLLVPYQPLWWVEYGAPVVVGAGGIVLICAFFYVVRLIWRRDTTEATYEPVGGFGRDDEP